MGGKQFVVFLMGPTASGKTRAAIDLHQQMGAEIISVDSAMVYRGMNIGTAKPSAAELAAAPHRLIDFLDPANAYSVAGFRNDALTHIDEIFANGKIPLLVGGTMMYFRSLQYGLSDLPKADAVVRAKLETEAAEYGWEAMHKRLGKIDPDSAARIHPNDPQRIQRALEVYEITGRSMTVLCEENKKESMPHRLIKIALQPEAREVLHERIAVRFQDMLANGFVNEVESLRCRGDLDLSKPSMRSVGYRQIWEYLDGKWTYDEMIDKAVIATRQLAKRQITWLRAEDELHWLDSNDENLTEKVKNLIEGIY